MHLFAALFPRGPLPLRPLLAPHEPFDDAQEGLALEVAARVPARKRTLDVGCGLGGTARLLAQRGHPCLGIDRCAPAIEYARASNDGTAGLRFSVSTFEEHRDQGGGPAFDALVMIEVLQHLPPLARTLRRALELLRPGGTLVVADVVNRSKLPWERVPFHPAGALAGQAGASGFACIESVDLTPRVAPTAARIAEAVCRSRAALRERFPARREIDAEIVELLRQRELIGAAFRNGDLGYELVTLRRERPA
jgi:SAM-dependent methyltransferase